MRKEGSPLTKDDLRALSIRGSEEGVWPLRTYNWDVYIRGRGLEGIAYEGRHMFGCSAKRAALQRLNREQ